MAGTGMKDNVISMWVANNDAKEWNFENYHMGDEGVTQLCKAIVAHKSRVEWLSLSGNNVDERCIGIDKDNTHDISEMGQKFGKEGLLLNVKDTTDTSINSMSFLEAFL